MNFFEDAALERVAQQRACYKALASLTPRQLEVVLLRWYQPWGFRRIGEHMQLTEKSAANLHAQAMRAIRSALHSTERRAA